MNEKTIDIAKLKQTKYFVNYLIKDENSMFYSMDRKKNRNLINKVRRSICPKDRIIIKLYNELKNKNN